MAKKRANYDLAVKQAKTLVAPNLPYQPAKVRKLSRPIGIIGCGGIAEVHCKAYQKAGFNVVALCDRIPERAENRRKTYFPNAEVYTDYKQLLARPDIEVVDIATHPQDREYLIPAALNAKKHVLSQKPFVLNLDKGRKFAELAAKNGVTLAVNQNGRWAPYFSYLRQAVNKGLIGETMSVHINCHWSHEWIKDTHFNAVHHIVLYDFAIHYFDMLNCLMAGKKPQRVTASLRHAPGQKATPPLLGQVLIEYENAQATLIFDAATPYGALETIYVAGTKGSLIASGNLCGIKEITLATKKGKAVTAPFTGEWFPEGFHGSMAELLSSIEQNRAPSNNALNNLEGLSICFAAVASSESGKPESVSKVKGVPVERCSVVAQKTD